MYSSILPTTDENSESKSSFCLKNNNNVYGSNKPIYNLKTPSMILNGLLLFLLSLHVYYLTYILTIIEAGPFQLVIVIILLIILVYFIFRKNIGTSLSEKFVLCRSKTWLRIIRNTIGEIFYNGSIFIIGICLMYLLTNEEIQTLDIFKQIVEMECINFGFISLLTIIREVFYTSYCNINNSNDKDLLRFCKITNLVASDFNHQEYSHKYIFYNAYFYKYFYNENSMLVDVNNIVRDPITEYKYTKYISLI